jgi:hypothetical protein
LKHGHRVKATVFALLAALFLFISLIARYSPASGSVSRSGQGECYDGVEEDEVMLRAQAYGRWVDLAPQVGGAIAAGFAGWHWLMDETNMKPCPYIFVILGLAGLMLAAILASRAVEILRSLLRRWRG